MCRHRFGVLNQLYEELLSEGINDVKFMGINGYQYINDSYSCMICDEPEDCSNCDENYTIPWAQDLDDGYNCLSENEGLCEANDEDGDLWDMWDISLRDLVILDRQGKLVAKINLTYTNPDPISTCGENYETIKNLILNAR
tara:strand:+ start:1126 stop:1548 length:423 start_codon:yes stop_codon:yes gene_type:complete